MYLKSIPQHRNLFKQIFVFITEMINKIKESVENHTTFGNFAGRIHEYALLSKFFLNPLLIKSIHLQFVNYCNLNCEYCSFANNPNKQKMKKELLTKLLEEILFDRKKFNVKELNLWVAGETLLHPDFFGMLELMKSYKQKSSRFPKVKLFTNVMLLTEKVSKKMIDSGVIDWIGFSVDGGSKENCDKIRRGSKFDIIKKNIANFQKYNKGKIITSVNCLVPLNQKLNSQWMSEEFQELLNMVDNYKLNYPMDVGIDISYPKDFKFYKWNKRVCKALIQGVAIVQNGDVLPCCSDFNNTCVIGNLYKESLSEICKGEKRRKMVFDFLKGKKSEIPLCRNCNRFSIPYKIFKKENEG